jgi:hypothetical protein
VLRHSERKPLQPRVRASKLLGTGSIPVARLKFDSVLGTYAITEEGETTLEAPLDPYRVTAEGEIEPAPVDQVGG